MKSYEIVNSTSANVSVTPFQPLHWRGLQKYFVITAVPVNNENGTLIFFKNITFTYDFEYYTMTSKVCDEDLLKTYMLQMYNKTMLIEMHNLHHYTEYSVTFQACNEKGCGPVVPEPIGFIFKTDEYIPTCSPSDIVLQNTSSTSIALTWSNLTKECSHGIICGYNVTMRRTRTGERIKKSVPTAMTVVFDNLEKYELICVAIGGYTSKGLGKVSGEVCAHTAEDGEFNLIYSFVLFCCYGYYLS